MLLHTPRGNISSSRRPIVSRCFLQWYQAMRLSYWLWFVRAGGTSHQEEEELTRPITVTHNTEHKHTPPGLHPLLTASTPSLRQKPVGQESPWWPRCSTPLGLESTSSVFGFVCERCIGARKEAVNLMQPILYLFVC